MSSRTADGDDEKILLQEVNSASRTRKVLDISWSDRLVSSPCAAWAAHPSRIRPPQDKIEESRDGCTANTIEVLENTY
jgi:hypothetical protein